EPEPWTSSDTGGSRASSSTFTRGGSARVSGNDPLAGSVSFRLVWSEEQQMPRAFMVKKVSVSPGKRTWSQALEREIGTTYTPGVPLSGVQTAASPAESSPSCPTWLEHIKCSGHVPVAELPSCSALAEEGPDPGGQADDVCANFFRPKIKVTTGEMDMVTRDSGLSTAPVSTPAVPPDVSPGPPVLACQVCQKCSHCERGFTQRCSLESHLRKIHGIAQPYGYKERRSKLYVCEECGLTALVRDTLRRHLLAAHPHSASAAVAARGGHPAREKGREEMSMSSPASENGLDSDGTAGPGEGKE
ncbi:putative transcription factor Ovo-like 1, partial [Scleropages formosus]